MTGDRRPLLGASLKGAAAVWVWRRVEAEAPGAVAALIVTAGPGVAHEVGTALAELREAARQWADRQDVVVGERVKGVGVASLASSGAMDGITMVEAGSLLGVSRQRVGQMRASGTLRGRRVGPSWLIDRGSVMDLLDARRSAS